jgi:hypothetical protein
MEIEGKLEMGSSGCREDVEEFSSSRIFLSDDF